MKRHWRLHFDNINHNCQRCSDWFKHMSISLFFCFAFPTRTSTTSALPLMMASYPEWQSTLTFPSGLWGKLWRRSRNALRSSVERNCWRSPNQVWLQQEKHVYILGLNTHKNNTVSLSCMCDVFYSERGTGLHYRKSCRKSNTGQKEQRWALSRPIVIYNYRKLNIILIVQVPWGVWHKPQRVCITDSSVTIRGKKKKKTQTKELQVCVWVYCVQFTLTWHNVSSSR